MRVHRVSWLGLGAAVLACAVVVIVLAIALDDDGGLGKHPLRASTAASTASDFAAALESHSTSTVERLSCPDQRDDVMHDATGLIDAVTAARVDGAVSVRGNAATATLSITAQLTYHLPAAPGQSEPTRHATPTISAPLRLARHAGGWCVSRFEAAVPSF